MSYEVSVEYAAGDTRVYCSGYGRIVSGLLYCSPRRVKTASDTWYSIDLVSMIHYVVSVAHYIWLVNSQELVSLLAALFPVYWPSSYAAAARFIVSLLRSQLTLCSVLSVCLVSAYSFSLTYACIQNILVNVQNIHYILAIWELDIFCIAMISIWHSLRA